MMLNNVSFFLTFYSSPDLLFLRVCFFMLLDFFLVEYFIVFIFIIFPQNRNKIYISIALFVYLFACRIRKVARHSMSQKDADCAVFCVDSCWLAFRYCFPIPEIVHWN